MSKFQTLNFDDIDTSAGDGLAAVGGYMGLNFQNPNNTVFAFNSSGSGGMYAGEGIAHGITSGMQDLIALDKLTVTAMNGKFDLKSFELTSGFDDTDTIEVSARDTRGHLIFDATLSANSTAPTLEFLNLKNVGSVTFKSNNDDRNYITIDDLTVKTSGKVPPSSVGQAQHACADTGSYHDAHALLAAHLSHGAIADF